MNVTVVGYNAILFDRCIGNIESIVSCPSGIGVESFVIAFGIQLS